jgi:TrmH family RNA methyltransferase
VSTREVRVRARSDDFQLIEALKRNRKKRAQCGLFIVEGVRPINLMHENGWVVDSYVFSEERRQSAWAQEIVSRSTALQHYMLSDELMAEVSDKQETSELMAIVETRGRGKALDSFALGDAALVVIADRPASPGNLGTLIRSCDALGADGLAVFGHAADIYDPRTVRASTGSLFRLPVVSVESPRVLESWLVELRKCQRALQVVGSSTAGPVNLATLNWTHPTILMIGSERTGLGRSLTEMCDAIVSIPISGAASSLNVASAASILLYEVARQRAGLTGQERS